ncbi:hypothetical protein [Lactobacillus crispatus]|uniref:hypothetical protein n=1 Tax=Lactobacillus crispatus TaxID=47770 RepID=UPI003F25F783
MLAWVTIDRQHKSYLSPIFARAIHKGNWDENKDQLINVDVYQNLNKNIKVHVVTVESDFKNWLPKDKYYGSIDFLAKYDPEELSKKISSQDLKKYIDYANNSHYQEIHQIKNKNDVVDLMEANFGFHDAHIDKIITKGDKTKILFEKSWGSQIEMTFEKYVSYRVEPYDTLATDWWGDGSLFSKNGFWFLCNGEDVDTINDAKNCGIYFSGKKVSYRVFPACY